MILILSNLDKRESRRAQKHIATSSFRTNRNAPYPTSPKPVSKSVGASIDSPTNIASPTLSRRCNRAKLSEQLYSSKEHFQSIAQKQADAEMMHAESAKVQAEASTTNALAVTEIAQAVKKMADAANLQAVNDSERIRVFEKLITVLENLLPTYLQD
ncbi:hypothetical protein PV328_011688 [Microctonus aethiopoides]|uniref:Uncharacterized protein n=1 Tax=Microctonus aethiopoides TaxID=144406 RepID=A0AA39C500_9HYME|nr:hypothetical protein PV328_011688 [Microctonus aethiopoides]